MYSNAYGTMDKYVSHCLTFRGYIVHNSITLIEHTPDLTYSNFNFLVYQYM